ncbi:MAG: hypothetical protein ACE37K_10945 [Planctomycetota bacterium]
MLIKSVALALAAISVPLTSSLWTSPSATTTPRRDVTLEGRIGGWFVEDDGTVLVRVEPEKGEHRWFRTPANQSSTTQFELLALHAVLHLQGEARPTDAPVCLRGEATTTNDGSSPEDALQLVAIGRK